ncbi:MAG: hypothetical protein M3198_01430 [Actinomycetota bacterium]|nr:hypothetical protein [Actinomycetota bacterium]
MGPWRLAPPGTILANLDDATSSRAATAARVNVENRIKATKGSGLERLPFTVFAANAA